MTKAQKDKALTLILKTLTNFIKVTYTPNVVTYKNRWVEKDYACGGKFSVLQIVFDHNILFEKVTKNLCLKLKLQIFRV